jgi:hypothetical protein
MDRECPTKGGNFGRSSTSHDNDITMVDAFGPARLDSACGYCGGLHFSRDCPSIQNQPLGLFQFQRFAAPAQPSKTLWDAAYDLDEEFDNGDPYSHYGYVNNSQYPSFYVPPKMILQRQQEEVRVDADGDVIMIDNW